MVKEPRRDFTIAMLADDRGAELEDRGTAVDRTAAELLAERAAVLSSQAMAFDLVQEAPIA